eukprot:417640-Pleurochrysis_carterae.AAC.1
MRACMCVRACARACVRACVRVQARARVRMRVCAAASASACARIIVRIPKHVRPPQTRTVVAIRTTWPRVGSNCFVDEIWRTAHTSRSNRGASSSVFCAISRDVNRCLG